MVYVISPPGEAVAGPAFTKLTWGYTVGTTMCSHAYANDGRAKKKQCDNRWEERVFEN